MNKIIGKLRSISFIIIFVCIDVLLACLSVHYTTIVENHHAGAGNGAQVPRRAATACF